MKFLTTALCVILFACLPARAAQSPSIDLNRAALNGDLDAVEKGVAAGVDLNAKDAYGSTPLTIAVTFGRTKVARALINAGADLAVADKHGSAPIHIAAFLGRVDIFKALIAKGADRFARNSDGSTAYDIAAGSFGDDLPVIRKLAAVLGPLGFKLDLAKAKEGRREIVALLQPSAAELKDVDFAPLRRNDWPLAKPAEVGLDRARLADLYLDAAHLKNVFGLLVVKDGKLVAERYFHEGGVDQVSTRHSITKSFLSALYGIALKQGCAPPLDSKMISYFPEVADRIKDARKTQITMRQMLEMRAGYPMEIVSPKHHDALFFTNGWNWIPHMVDFPLVADPGTKFGYSNLTSELIAIALARSCKTDLEAFANKTLFAPLGATLADWSKGAKGYRMGWGQMSVTARDMATFGQLYLDGGKWKGRQIVPAAWVADSLKRYSNNAWTSPRLGRYFGDVGYGYQWWSAKAGAHPFDFAWGHGGQLIVLLHDLDMVIVTTADPQLGIDPLRQPGWEREVAIINVVGKFIAGLPTR